jgi:hypothetical protein
MQAVVKRLVYSIFETTYVSSLIPVALIPDPHILFDVQNCLYHMLIVALTATSLQLVR